MGSKRYIPLYTICLALFAQCGGSSNTNSNGGSGGNGSGGSSVGTGGTSSGSGGMMESTGGAPGTGGTMDSTGGAPGTGGTEVADSGGGGGEGMDAAPEVATTPGMCAAKPAMTDPPLGAQAFCQELAATCKAHYMMAFNTAAKCMTAYGNLKNAACSSYHLCLAAAKMNVVGNCASAQGAAPCNK